MKSLSRHKLTAAVNTDPVPRDPVAVASNEACKNLRLPECYTFMKINRMFALHNFFMAVLQPLEVVTLFLKYDSLQII
jgi:hypothetical protein